MNEKGQICRKWFGTLNNPEEPDNVDAYLRRLHEVGGAQYVCGQLERGEEGTLHLQYAVWFKSTKRLTGLKKLCERTHWEPMRNEDAFDYCMKEDTRVAGPWEYGQRPIRRNNKTDWATAFEHAKKGEFDKIDPDVQFKHFKNMQAIRAHYKQTLPDLEDCRGVWIHGPPGTGKTQFVKDSHPFGSIYNKDPDKFWDGFRDEQHYFCLLDDIDPETCSVFKGLAQRLKLWTDKNALDVQIKGSRTSICPKLFYITSNYTIEECFPRDRDAEAIRDRCKVIHFNQLVPFKRSHMLDRGLEVLNRGVVDMREEPAEHEQRGDERGEQ